MAPTIANGETPMSGARMDYPGVFGPITATIDWCEYNYLVSSFFKWNFKWKIGSSETSPIQVTKYIAEFWNTLSNLCIIIPAVMGFIDAKSNKVDLETRWATDFMHSTCKWMP